MERKGATPDTIRRVLPEMFGKNHDGVLLYLETVCVDSKGYPVIQRLSCNPARHPDRVPSYGVQHWKDGYSTVLKDGTAVSGHDDWDVIDDLVLAELLEWRGTGAHPRFWLTDAGWARAHELRRRRAEKAYKT